eukprot:scaffold225834_cov36-Prasinocladus_malaysianus.AAC.1
MAFKRERVAGTRTYYVCRMGDSACYWVPVQRLVRRQSQGQAAAHLANPLRTGPYMGKLGTGDKDCRPVALSSGALGPEP